MVKVADAARTYWTRDRVLLGLKRFYKDVGETPTSSEAYHRHVCGQGKRHTRRYPSYYGVLRYFETFRQAWEAAGIPQNRWDEEWSPLEEWFLREAAGILTRKEIAAELRRSPDAVHRRLYDLGIHSYRNHGWSLNRVERECGIPASTVRRYIRQGIIPCLRGSKVVYVDPADLLAIWEIDWEHPPTDLEVDVRRSLLARLLTVLNGRNWREGRPYQFERTTKVPYQRRAVAAPTPRPVLAVGDLVRCAHLVETRASCFGRDGVIRALFWSSMRTRQRADIEPGWFARVEFRKVRRDAASQPRVTYTLPMWALEPQSMLEKTA